MILVFIGIVGSGKMILMGEFGKYFFENGYRVVYVNLDMGVRKFLYIFDFDVREKVIVWSFMDEGFGLNGVIVKSYDIFVEYMGEYVEKIREFDKEFDYVLIDILG